MAGKRNPPTPSIDEVRVRFEQWRQTRQGRARIPEELWAAAVGLARRNGVNRTAAALHLDGGKLKRRMEVAKSGRGKAAPAAFVELLAADAAGVPEYSIELEGRNGKLCIRCKGTTVADLAGLSRALWEITS